MGRPTCFALELDLEVLYTIRVDLPKTLADVGRASAIALLPAGPASEVAGVGSAGSATALAPSEGSTVTLFHQGELTNGEVSAMRSLSTSTSSNLTHYHPEGQLYEFQVPRSTLSGWQASGLARPYTDMHAPTGIVTSETRIMPPASW